MGRLLAKVFIKDYKNIKCTKVRNAYGTLSSVVGIILNALLSIAKIILGSITASISIIADGINNLSDMASSGVSLIGFKMAGRPADNDHPFGHARMEYISALIISLIIIVVGVQLSINSFQSIFSAQPTSITNIALIIISCSIIVKFAMALFYRSNAKLINSTTLRACALDSINDCLASTVILISLIITKFTSINLDGYAGTAMAIYIFVAGIKLLKETLSPLLGEKPDNQLVGDIIDKVLAYKGILGVHDIMCHNYGQNKHFISLHAEVDSQVNVLQSHELIDLIESDLSNEDLHVLIHMDPIITNDPRIDELKSMVRSILSEISNNLHMHDFRAVIGPNKTNLIFDLVVPDRSTYDCETLIKVINDRIHDISPSCMAVISIDYPYTDIHEKHQGK